MPSPSQYPESTDENPVVRQVKDDLAHQLDILAESIELIEYNEVVWPDTSLDCPQPEMTYAQVITPGYRIRLEAKGRRYAYHADKSQHVVLCEMKETPSEPVPVMPIAPHGKPPKCQWTPCP